MKNLFILLFLLFPFVSGIAQSDEIPEITSKFLIRNANIIVKPGQELSAASVLIEDGFITRVGTSLEVPFDAQIIDADSMYIYPGFIAGISHIGVPTEEAPKEAPKVKDPGNPPNELAGITPEQSLRDVLNVSDKSIAAYRKSGVTISHSVPKGKMLPGKGSIIILNGASIDEMLMEEDVSLFAKLSGASRMYPATVMAVMAKYRELFKNASIASSHEKSYKSQNSGMKRPNYDKSIKGLYSAANKDIPVFFSVPKTRDIQRALRLQKELGFNIIPTDIKQGWLNIDKLKNFPLLLSLDLPKEMKEEKKKKNDKEETEDQKMFKAKKKKAYDSYVGQSKLFADKGLGFSFSLLNTKAGDIQKNLHRLVENGLSADQALAAMTTHPAKTLGIENSAGSIEKNKLANLIVSNKPYFEKGAKIKYVFVEGKKFEYDIAEKKKASSDSTATRDLSGTYKYTVEIPGMTTTGKIVVSKTDDNYDIEITSDESPGEPSEAEGIEQDGETLSYSFKTETQGATITVDMNLEFEADTFEGTVSVPQFGSFPVTGEKVDPKNQKTD